MVVFEIIDNSDKQKHLLGYLFYFERSKRFFTELLAEYDEWTCPFIFSGFVKKGIYNIGSEWSRKFVEQRIVPPDRQNLGMILRDNNLKEYDEYRLLVLSEGRCAQDELSVLKINENALVPEITERLNKKVQDLLPLAGNKLLIFFKDGRQAIFDCGKHLKTDRRFLIVLSDPDIFNNVHVTPGGNGIEWGKERCVPAEDLYSLSKKATVTYQQMLAFLKTRTIDTTEAATILDCSRQYVGQLAKQGKLTPVHVESNNSLFLRSDLESECK